MAVTAQDMKVFAEFESTILDTEPLVDGKLLVMTETGN